MKKKSVLGNMEIESKGDEDLINSEEMEEFQEKKRMMATNPIVESENRLPLAILSSSSLAFRKPHDGSRATTDFRNSASEIPNATMNQKRQKISGAMESIVGPLINGLKIGWTLHNSNQRNLDMDMENLKSKTDELSSREHDLMIAVEKEEVEQGKKRKREVDMWLENVKRIKNEVESIESEVREKSRWFSHYNLTKLIAAKTAEAAQLYDEGKFSDGVAVETLPGSGSPQPVSTLLGESADRTLKRIWNCLMDREVGKVGVHGMAGVGKTTILKHINNQLLETHSFGSIIWVTVSKALNLQKLQSKIAKAIELDWSDDDDEESRSSKICEELAQRERFLLILDDVWEPFSLTKIGIPEPNQSNGYKIVLTTRSLQVCRGMESERIIKVEVLSEKEAWDLFKAKVGGSVLLSSQIEPIAVLVCRECGRLPLAIITVGRALREEDDVSVWRNALNELSNSYTEIEGMDDFVFPRLKFSYDRLKSEKIRACFLYCALYPEDYEIDTRTLVEDWLGNGLIDDVGDMVEEKKMGHTILIELKDACMIEEGDDSETIKVHDLIRDLAINITRGSPCFMVKAGEELMVPPRWEEWKEGTERVSLMENDIRVLSVQPVCPKLSTLLLQGNILLKQISNSFFEHIQNLKVLDLSYASIHSLPDSFSELNNLHLLRLHNCDKLNEVPSLEKLKQLRLLDLSSTGIRQFPHGTEELHNLKSLNLCRTKTLLIFPAGIISKLLLLEELLMHRFGLKWALNSVEVGRATPDIEEIVSSRNLANLSLSFPDLQGFHCFIASGKWQFLKSFFITLGTTMGHHANVSGRKVIAVGGLEDAFHPSSLILPSNIEVLEIQKWNDIVRLSQLSCLENATELNSCTIERCNKMEFIVMANENTLPTRLETLNLVALPKLKDLCHGVIPLENFANLKTLSVRNCNNLKNLFSLGLLRHFKTLEHLTIRDCYTMEAIVVEDSNATSSTIALPCLKTLDLRSLVELNSICKTLLACTSLVSLCVVACRRLKKLPLSASNLSPNFKELRAFKSWWNSLEWDDPSTKSFIEPHFIDMSMFIKE